MEMSLEKRIQFDVQKYGASAVKYFVDSAPYAALARDLSIHDPDITWLESSRHFFSMYATKDPSPTHYALAREIIENEPKLNECSNDNLNRAIDATAREITETCRKLYDFLCTSITQHKIPYTNIPRDREGINIPLMDIPIIKKKHEMNILDKAFYEFIEKLGKVGKERAVEGRDASKRLFSFYIENNCPIEAKPRFWNLWLDEQKTNIPLALIWLSEIVWSGIRTKVITRANSCPAISNEIHNKFLEAYHPNINIIKEKNICIKNKGKIQLYITTDEMMDLGRFESKYLRSLTAHKLWRFFRSRCYEKWAAHDRCLNRDHFKGGCEEIAKLVGLNGKSYTTEVKSILYIMANTSFDFGHKKTSALIILTSFKSPTTQKNYGITITYGSEICPDSYFQNSSPSQLLIPMPSKMPPFVGSPQYFGAQANLQERFMAYFSQFSRDLANQGFVHVSADTWLNLAHESGLPENVLPKLTSAWINGSPKEPPFIIPLGQNQFKLGQAYSAEEAFLIEQGQRRQNGFDRQKKKKIPL